MHYFPALTFVLTLLFSFALLVAAVRPRTREQHVQSRLRMIQRAGVNAPGGASEPLPVVRDRLTARIGRSVKRYHLAAGLERLLLHAGSKSSVGSIVLMSVGLAIAGGSAVHLLAGSFSMRLAATLVGGAFPCASLTFQKKRRLKKFDAALPDSIELMARALRAGHSMASSIEIISEQSPAPLAGEFAICFQQQRYGVPFRDALLEVGRRVPSRDLHFLVTAILVQKDTGGDLTDILDRTTHVIRDRIRIQGEVRTYTAQGRLTGWILSLLPIIMLAIINFISPGYSKLLFTDPLGQKLLYAGGILILIGGLLISKIVDIKV